MCVVACLLSLATACETAALAVLHSVLTQSVPKYPHGITQLYSHPHVLLVILEYFVE